MYIIKRDDLFLMAYRHTGIREMLTDGKLTEVYTCLWCSNPRDAKAFDEESVACGVAKAIGGGEVMTLNKRRRLKRVRKVN